MSQTPDARTASAPASSTADAAPRMPARYDHVGSLLRPAFLLQARQRFADGGISAAELRQIEDRAIREAVRFQQEVGLRSITDGEYRRGCFHIDFLDQLDGVDTTQPRIIVKPDGSEVLQPPMIRVSGKVRHARNIQVEDLRFLRGCLCEGCRAKVSIPSPTMLHFRGGREGISRDAYPQLEPAFYEDVARAYGDELHALHAAGCDYVQLDDTNLAYLCDPQMREAARGRGDDPDELTHRYADFVNRVVAHRPPGMLLAMHLCRGNFRSTFAASGDYEPVAEALLSQMHIDAYFMEYDDERSGGFAPLRFLPRGKIAVLGLISTKTGQMENIDDVKRRIDEAARYAPLEQLALSPQCGFASDAEGNRITWDDQRRKLELVIRIADEVWGGK